MKSLIILTFLLILVRCSPFHQLSKATKIGTEDGYVTVTHEPLKLKSLTFGDFKFATKNKEYKKLNQHRSSYDNVLFYARTDNPSYDYYLLVDPVDTTFNLLDYELEKVIGQKQRLYLLISKTAPISDAMFIRNNFTVE